MQETKERFCEKEQEGLDRVPVRFHIVRDEYLFLISHSVLPFSRIGFYRESVAFHLVDFVQQRLSPYVSAEIVEKNAQRQFVVAGVVAGIMTGQ